MYSDSIRLTVGFADIVSNNLLGFSSKRISGKTPNMYLKHWMENGLLGLLVYLTMIGCAFRYFMNLKDHQGIADHNLLQNKTFLVLLGLFGKLAYLVSRESMRTGFIPSAMARRNLSVLKIMKNAGIKTVGYVFLWQSK